VSHPKSAGAKAPKESAKKRTLPLAGAAPETPSKPAAVKIEDRRARRIPVYKPRSLITLDAKAPAWLEDEPACLRGAPGTFFRLRPPAGKEEAARALAAKLLDAGALGVKVELPPGDVAVPAGDRTPAAPVGSAREVVLGIANDPATLTVDRAAMLAEVEIGLAAAKL
jgi:hypothetical protein